MYHACILNANSLQTPTHEGKRLIPRRRTSRHTPAVMTSSACDTDVRIIKET